jgi:diaminopimelate decarboxylase
MGAHETILREAIRTGAVGPDLTAIGVMDFDGLGATVAALDAAFPAPFRHTFAVKANALHAVLARLAEAGIGAEVASPGELALALAAGFPPERIIYDSPAKTRADITDCLARGIAFNLDNEQEMQRVDELIGDPAGTTAVIGFRVNPQIGSGKISSTSTATSTSKFGFPLGDGDNRARLLGYYATRPWMTSIHTHTGSQGCPLELMAEGVAHLHAFAEEVNAAAGRRQIVRLDIGGGLPVNFASDEVKPTFADYAAVLRARVPALFDGAYEVKTEFGRAIAAKNGFIVTRVEYTKSAGGRFIATTHAGAQIMARTAFLPHAWPVRVSGFAPDGKPRTADPVETDVAGPCCFAADLVAKEVTIPRLHPDDYVVVHDTGAYYFSNHFDYNSLPRVAVYAAEAGADGPSLRLIRRADTLTDVVRNMS